MKATKTLNRVKRYNKIEIMPFFVYILECTDGSFYVGCTNELKKRIKQHNESKWGAHYTKIRRPVKLKYYEEFATLIHARRRESEIKGWRREKKLSLMKQECAKLGDRSEPVNF